MADCLYKTKWGMLEHVALLARKAPIGSKTKSASHGRYSERNATTNKYKSLFFSIIKQRLLANS